MHKLIVIIILILFVTTNSVSSKKGDFPIKNLQIMEQLANNFLITLNKEDYIVLASQRSLFTHYEKFLFNIFDLSTEQLNQKNVLLIANLLFKGANIYRRIADQNSLKLAKKYHQKALELRIKVLNNNAIEIADSLAALGATYNESKGKLNNIEAAKYFEQGLEICKKNNKNGKYCAANILFMIGSNYRDLDEKNVNIAIKYSNDALKILDTLPKNNLSDKTIAKILYNQGLNYQHLGNKDNLMCAIKYFNKAKTFFEEDEDLARLAITLGDLGNSYRCLGKDNLKLAIEHLNKALNIQKDLFGEECTQIAKTLYYLGMAYGDLTGIENINTSIKYLQHALKIQKKLLSVNHQNIARTMYNLGLVYLLKEEFSIGIPLIKESLITFNLSPNHYYFKNTAITVAQLKDLLIHKNSEESKMLLGEINAWLASDLK